jgi:hypothetical protein
MADRSSSGARLGGVVGVGVGATVVGSAVVGSGVVGVVPAVVWADGPTWLWAAGTTQVATTATRITTPAIMMDHVMRTRRRDATTTVPCGR